MNFNLLNIIYQQDLSIVNSLDCIPWHKLENKSLLLTGATGLIGSFLVDVLMYRNEHYCSNISIYAVSRNPETVKERFKKYLDSNLFRYVQHDVSEKLIFDFNADFIIHSAGNATPYTYVVDPVGTLKTNIYGMDNLLSYAVNTHSECVLYVSSGEVYGEGNGNDFTETYSGYVDCMNLRACYPSGKRATETLCASYSAQYDVNVVIARPCHIYGPTMTQSDNRAFAQFIRNILSKQNVVLKSKGEQYRSYCYGADCVSAILTILLKGEKSNAYNIANKKSNVTVAELAKTIAMAGKQQVAFELPVDEEKRGYSVVTRAVLNADKLEKLGWKAQYSLKEGIERTVQILSAKNKLPM
jgi:nucleoside-diphosphate-sugar epimerase